LSVSSLTDALQRHSTLTLPRGRRASQHAASFVAMIVALFLCLVLFPTSASALALSSSNSATTTTATAAATASTTTAARALAPSFPSVPATAAALDGDLSSEFVIDGHNSPLAAVTELPRPSAPLTPAHIVTPKDLFVGPNGAAGDTKSTGGGGGGGGTVTGPSAGPAPDSLFHALLNYFDDSAAYEDDGVSPRDTCTLTDSFGWWVQSLGGFAAFSVLVIKWQWERPQRPFVVWAMDATKNCAAQVLRNNICTISQDT